MYVQPEKTANEVKDIEKDIVHLKNDCDTLYETLDSASTHILYTKEKLRELLAERITARQNRAIRTVLEEFKERNYNSSIEVRPTTSQIEHVEQAIKESILKVAGELWKQSTIEYPPSQMEFFVGPNDIYGQIINHTDEEWKISELMAAIEEVLLAYEECAILEEVVRAVVDIVEDHFTRLPGICGYPVLREGVPRGQ